MHVWATGNGVASAEKRYESPSFDQKETLQEKLNSQRWVIFIFEAKSLKSNRIKYPITQAKGQKESVTSVRIKSCF